MAAKQELANPKVVTLRLTDDEWYKLQEIRASMSLGRERTVSINGALAEIIREKHSKLKRR